MVQLKVEPKSGFSTPFLDILPLISRISSSLSRIRSFVRSMPSECAFLTQNTSYVCGMQSDTSKLGYLRIGPLECMIPLQHTVSFHSLIGPVPRIGQALPKKLILMPQVVEFIPFLTE